MRVSWLWLWRVRRIEAYGAAVGRGEERQDDEAEEEIDVGLMFRRG